MSDTKAIKTGEDGRDANGIRVGEWETGLCGCFTDIVPNCLMVWCIPFISVAQISSRIGYFRYSTVLLVTLLTYALLLACFGIAIQLILDATDQAIKEDPNALSSTLGPTATKTAEKASSTLAVMQVISSLAGFVYFIMVFQLRTKVRDRFQLPGNCCSDFFISLWCSCCSVAQIATHVKSYKPGSCAFGPVDTLPAYE